MSNIPNILTLSRAIVALYILIALPKGTPLILLIIWAMASDFLDGFLARCYNWVSKFGAGFDLNTDGLFFFASFWCFWHQGLLTGLWFGLILLFSIPEIIAQGIFWLRKGQGIGSPGKFWNRLLGAYSYLCVLGIALRLNAVWLVSIFLSLLITANGMDLYLSLTCNVSHEKKV